MADSAGARFHADLEVALDEVFLKGRHSASFTGFDGGASSDEEISLGAWLESHNIDEVDVVGLATDHCVRATAIDAQAAGFATTVLLEHCAGVAADSTESALEEMAAAGITLVD